MFKEFYYLMYSHLLKVKTNDRPAFNAYLITCMLMCLNIITCIIISRYLFNIDFKINKDSTIYFGLFLAISISIVNYFTLYLKRTSIFDKYKEMPKERESKRRIIWRIYEILSYLTFFIACANLIR